ncbi:MAG: hypothetical protein WC943_08740 [Elusimicrobiota bacterium]|jgi:sugar lactone lactonase YvrE
MMSVDPFRKVWHEEYRREVEEVLSGLRSETSKPGEEPGPVDAVIPPARVFQELKASREKLASLIPQVEDLRHRLATADARLDEETRKREKLKDIIVRLNSEVRRLEGESRHDKDRSEAGIRRLDEALRKTRASEAAQAELSQELERSRDREAQLKGVVQSLKIRAEELQAVIDARDAEVQSLKKRYDVACAQHGAQLVEREQELAAAQRRLAEKQVQVERALSEREGQSALSLAAKTELAGRLSEFARLSVELQSARESLRTEREAHAAAKASWDDEIERRRCAEVQIREAGHQLELERQAAAARMEAVRQEHEKSLAAAKDALTRVESESLRAHATLEEARKFEADCATLFRKQMEELQDERQRFFLAHRKELADAQAVKDQGQAALEAAHKLEAECRERSEYARKALEMEREKLMAEAKAMKERGLEIEQRALAALDEERAKLKAEYESAAAHFLRSEVEDHETADAERAKLQAEYEASQERARKAQEAARQALEAEKARLHEEVRDRLEKAAKAELAAVTQVAEMERLLQVEKERMKSGVKEALSEVAAARAEAAASAEAARRALSQERARLDAEKSAFLKELDAERRKLYAALEAESREAAAESEHRLKAERAALRRELEDEAALKLEQALLHREKESQRLAIESQAKAELAKALSPAPKAAESFAAVTTEMVSMVSSEPAPVPPAPKPEVPPLAPVEAPTLILVPFPTPVPAPVPAPAPAPVVAEPVVMAEAQASEQHAAPPASDADHAFVAGFKEAPGQPLPGAPASASSRGVRPLLGRLVLAAVLTAAAVAAAAGYLHLRFSAVSHPVPFKHPTALVWVGDELWVSDWFDQAVYRMGLDKGKLSVLQRYSLPGSHVTGLAVDGSTLYLADSWKREIQRYEAGLELTLSASWPSPGPSPSALSFDGKYLWSGDSGSNTIYRHAIDESLSVLNAYPVSFSPVCLEREGGLFWSAGSGLRMILKLDERMGLSEAFVHPRLEDGWQSLSCMAAKDGRFWVGRDGLGLLQELPKASLRNVPPPVLPPPAPAPVETDLPGPGL